MKGSLPISPVLKAGHEGPASHVLFHYNVNIWCLYVV